MNLIGVPGVSPPESFFSSSILTSSSQALGSDSIFLGSEDSSAFLGSEELKKLDPTVLSAIRLSEENLTGEPEAYELIMFYIVLLFLDGSFQKKVCRNLNLFVSLFINFLQQKYYSSQDSGFPVANLSPFQYSKYLTSIRS